MSLEEIDTEASVLYELKCPNPDCICAIHTRGHNVKMLDAKIRNESGCPVCKLQFGENDIKGYQFKKGEIEHEVLKNNGRWPGFIIRRLIYVPERIFQEYGQRLFGKKIEELSREETDAIAQKFYEGNEWQSEQDKLLELLKEKFPNIK